MIALGEGRSNEKEKQMNWQQELRQALYDPACHDSLKTAIRAFINCDPVDVVNDLNWLSGVFEQRLLSRLIETKGQHSAPTF